jgi:glycolate oxidase FAD binding subunit
VQAGNLAVLREKIERDGGSLVMMRPFPGMEAWGNTQNNGGGALALMRSIKKHFDPRGILNPGVFVGGI